MKTTRTLPRHALSAVTGGYGGTPQQAWDTIRRTGEFIANIPRAIYNHGYEWGNKPGPV